MEISDDESESEIESSNTLTETEKSDTLTETEKSDNNQETVNSSTKMRPDGLPDDFEHLSETEQKSAENTKARRAEPLSVSEHDPNKSYGRKQLKIKGLKHLEDYKYDTKNMSEDEIIEKTKEISEDIISDPKSKIYKNATAHGIEDAVVIIRPDPLSMVAFDDHPRNEGKQHFISTYTISKDAHDAFLDTVDGMELPPELVDRISEWPNLSVSKTIGENGETIYKTRGPNMGEGVLERERREQEQKEQKATLSPTAPSTYDSILPRFRLTNKQIRDAENLRKEVQEKSVVLNERETKLLKRFTAREKELARLENQLDLDNQGEL